MVQATPRPRGHRRLRRTVAPKIRLLSGGALRMDDEVGDRAGDPDDHRTQDREPEEGPELGAALLGGHLRRGSGPARGGGVRGSVTGHPGSRGSDRYNGSVRTGFTPR